MRPAWQRTSTFETPDNKRALSRCSSDAPTRSSRSARSTSTGREDGHRVRRPPLLSADHEPPPAAHGRQLRGEDHRLRQERRRRQLHLLAAAGHVRAGRLRQGDRQPGDRVAAARGADLPRRHALRRDDRARQDAVHVQERPRHRPRRDQGLQAGRHPGLRLPAQGHGADRATYIKERGGEQPGRPELQRRQK